MKGTVLDFSIQENSGIISGEDGKRYRFNGASWKQDKTPVQGMKVDFDLDDNGNTIDIYPDLEARSSVMNFQAISSPSDNISTEEAILWFLCCMPIGFTRLGQGAKGWLWVLAAIFTTGVAAIPAMIDYWMSYSASQKREIGQWEIFPR